MHGIRSFYASVRFLRPCQKLSSSTCTFRDGSNLYHTSCSSLRIPKRTSKVNCLYFINFPATCYSTKPSPLSGKAQLNGKIMSLKAVEDHLEVFDSVKNSASIVNKVTMLHSIAKITIRDKTQKRILEQEQEKAQQGEGSRYLELLDSISKDISKYKPRSLANLLWALGRIPEKEHKLVDVCEKEILLRGIMAFHNSDNSHITHIMNGCANLNLRTSVIFKDIQEAILTDQIKIEDFDDKVLSALLLSFARTENGSVEMFDVVLKEILSRDLAMIGSRQLANIVWSFAKMDFKADELFERVETEILRRGTADLVNVGFIQVLWAFSRAEKGSEELFSVLDNELAIKGVERFVNSALLQIVWSFVKRNVKKAKVIDLVKKEILSRGVHRFESHHLVLILWSFVSAERYDDTLVAEIEAELCLRDLKQLGNGSLRQVSWSLGRAGKSDSQLFDAIEAEVFQRGTSEFSFEGVRMLMRGFLEAKRGSKGFFKLLVSTISAEDFSNLSKAHICEFAWCLSKVDVETGALFDALEKEIISKDYCFNEKELVSLKKSFQEAGRESTAIKIF